jgi:hypothetical protein
VKQDDRTSTDEINARSGLTIKKERVKEAVDWRVNIMTAGLVYDVTCSAVTVICK